MADTCPEEFIAFAGRLAEASGEVIRQYFRADFQVETKSDASPVTVADRGAESAMRALIEETYPEHGIMGEEFDYVRTDAEHVWILDPIDGTKAFVTGMPVFGTLIALMQGDRPILGVIDQPIMRERWIGAAGRQTTLNGNPVASRQDSTLQTANHYATHPDMFAGADWDKVSTLIAEVELSRYGGDCYAYALVASGFIDLVTEAGLQVYDFMPLVPVVEGAGGIMTDWNGDRLTRESKGHVVAAANAACHEAAVQILRDRS